MSWRNESENDQSTRRSSVAVGTLISYVLIFLAAATVVCALQIGYSFASVRGCTFSQASNLAWHWFTAGPIWLVAVAVIWLTARAAAVRLR
jgi:hypothetical protein